MSQGLYSERLLEHHRHPRHSQAVEAPTHRVDTANRMCGDRIELALRIEGERIEAIGVVVDGCALAVAGGSVLAEYLYGKPVTEAVALEASSVLHLLGDIQPSPARLHCALLGLEALRRALR